MRGSIKLKVTVWFTLLMILIIAACSVFILLTGEHAVGTTTEHTLEDVVDEAAAGLDYESGHLLFDSDLGFYSQGVYISYYDAATGQVFGKTPESVDDETFEYLDNTVQRITRDETWVIYDSAVHVGGYGKIWVRGMMSETSSYAAMSVFVKLALILLPIFVVMAASGGYLITVRAFRPVKHITEIAQSISNGNDLSRRINLSGADRDEIYTLANTFDTMFDRLETAFENEKQFASDASHELRTPISVIISQCEYALEGDRPAEELRQSLESIKDQAQKMSGLISQLLTLSRVNKGQDKLSFEPVNLSELCAMVADELSEPASEKNITITTDLAPDIMINGDQTMLIRMLINLASNAVKYGKENGHITITLRRENSRIVGHVIDDGIGIPPVAVKKIWKRFYQVDPARSSESEGNGLGLSMVKWIVEAHGGTISVSSKLNEGSDFVFVLPAKKSPGRGNSI